MKHCHHAIAGSAFLWVLSLASMPVAAQSTLDPQETVDAASELPPQGDTRSGRAGGATVTYPSDENRLDGDHLTLRVNISPFYPLGEAAASARCAPKDSKIAITKDAGDVVTLRFLSVPDDKELGANSAAAQACPAGDRVDDATQYSISRNVLLDYDVYRSGVTFGALVVPFKFYLGGDKKISASSTIAPYVGFRGPAPFGLTFTPVLSAGLGLVPVSNPDTGKTDTKTALSTAVGMVLTARKNEAFNAGLLLGKDFLGRADREIDPTVGKAWFSIYVGYSK